MSLSDIYTALFNSLTGTPPNQQIDLFRAATDQPALTPMLEVLGLFGIASSYTLTSVQLTQTVNEVVLIGNGTFGAPNAPPENKSGVRGQLVGASPEGQNRFSLSLAVQDTNWDLSKLFPVLPVCQIADAETKSVGLEPSFLIGLPFDQVTFAGRNGADEQLRFSAQLPLSSTLEPWADLFAPWPLRADGTLTMPASIAVSPPSLEIVALAPSQLIEVWTVRLQQIGLRMSIFTGLDPLLNRVSELSVLDVIGTVYLGENNPIPAHLSTNLLAVASVWNLKVEFDEDVLVLPGLQQIALFFGLPVSALLVPDNFVDFIGFYLSEVEVGLIPPSSGSVPVLDHLGVTLRSNKEWNPPLPFVRVNGVGTRWMVGWTSDSLTPDFMSGCVWGTVQVGGDPPPGVGATASEAAITGPGDDPTLDSFHIGIVAYIPQFVVTGELWSDDRIPIGAGFRYFFGDPGPPTPSDMAITQFRFEAAPLTQTYSAAALVTMDWTVRLGANVSITIVALYFRILVTQGSVNGWIAGDFILQGGAPSGQPDPVFNVGAEYTSSGSTSGWVFSGALYPNSVVELVSLVSNFLGITPPTSLPTLTIEKLAVRFATVSQAYALDGTIVGRWTPTLFGGELAISAMASVDVVGAGNGASPQGSLLGRFAINKIAISAGINLKVNEPTYLFKVEFGDVWLTATTSWRGEQNNRHQVITLRLGGVTVGDILEYFVNLAAPTLGYSLDSPWDILNRIELSNFQLTIDPAPSANSIELIYDANADLVFMRLDQIGVRYRRINGEPAVELILTGRFLDKTYTLGDPLAWNVISDPPPAVPGDGNSLLDLRYLGVGQRVALKPPLPDTVRGTLDRLREDMKPITDPNKNPLDQSELQFAADSEWLIGLDAILLDTLQLGIVFNDPRLYGLSIALSGERAGSLAGFSFEILYKKITDEIGMFRIELQVPEAFRHIEMGEVSITLGIIVVEIYTNGNFLVDLGFPYSRNFARSFTVQVFPFLGRGGIYFGVLNGSTSRRVPKITNGNFSPVLELGVGLAVGVGKEVSVGPLSGGIFVEVEVIFQGVLAWFNPTSNGVPAAQYYWVQGIAAIHGKLYGKVDFKIIKVSVTIEAFAQASVLLEACKPTLFRLNVGVKVKAKVKVLFVTISFSFNATLDVSFTVGSQRATPWILADGQGSSTTLRLRGNSLPAPSRDQIQRSRVLLEQHLLTLPSSGTSTSNGTSAVYVLNWNASLPVFTDSPVHRDFTMLPAFSISQVPVNWDGTQPQNPDPQYRVCFLIFAPNGIPPAADDVEAERSVEASSHAADTSELSSDTLIEAFLRWSISAVTGSPGNNPAVTITAGQLQLLVEQMSWSQTADLGFSIGNLSTFFQTNLWLNLKGDPGADPTGFGGMAFPVPPFLAWTSPQAGSINFATYNKVGPLYAWGANKYLSRYFPLPPTQSAPPTDDPQNYESYAAFVFCDWCLMVAKAAVQAAVDAMTGLSVPVTAPTSLIDVAQRYPTVQVTYTVRAGDTVDSVAATLGDSPAGLVYLNPGLEAALAAAPAGSTLQIGLGVTPESVAVDNATVTLIPGMSLRLGDIDYQAQTTDTLARIATRFNLSEPMDLFTGTALADDMLLLNPGAAFQSQASVYTPPSGFNAVLTAAVFYVRYYGRIDVPHAEWYAQTVFDLNASAALAGWDYHQPIPAGITLKAPRELNNTDPANTFNYTTVAGETLMRIGGALSLYENYATGTGPDPDWPPFRDQVQPSGNGMSIPTATITILPGETVNTLAARTIIYAGNVSGLLNWIGNAPILNSLTLIRVPNVTAATERDGATLAALATRFGLSVAVLGSRISTENIFTGSTTLPLTLTIANLPVQWIDTLVTEVLGGSAPVQISGMCSRFLLGGVSLPAPEDDGHGHKVATGPVTSINDTTGQQFAGPIPDLTQPGAVALSVTVTVNAGINWIQLVDSTTALEGEDLSSLASRFPGTAPEMLQARNRGLAEPSRLKPGIVVDIGDASSLVFDYTNQQLSQDYPATGLGVQPARGPMPMPLSTEAPRTYGLDHRIELQSPVPIPIPAPGRSPLTGNASLWPFSNALLLLAHAATSTRYDVVLTPVATDASSRSQTLEGCTFATLLPFAVRRLESREHVFELIGADTANRQLLFEVWRYIQSETGPPATQAFLLLAPAPNAGNPSGLGALAVDPLNTYLIKTNQTTETAMGPAPPAPAADAGLELPAPSQYYADFRDLARFLILLWEGSVVGGTGYYFGFSATDGKDIPASAFDERGNATLYLLVIAGSQQALAPNGRPFLSFNNCAAAAPGLDTSANALWVEAADDSDLMSVATVPPGNLGFTFTLPTPAQGSNPIQSLFSLATYQIPAIPEAPFQMPLSGFPVPPQSEDGQHVSAWRRQRLARWARSGRAVAEEPITSDFWRYDQVLPVSRFGPASLAPPSPGLPDPADDPYRGIGSQSLATAVIQLGFSDLFGNLTVLPGTLGPLAPGAVPAPAGYTDSILGLSNWPAVTSSFGLTSQNNVVTLTVTISPQPAATAPSPGATPLAAIDAANLQVEKYAQAYFQLIQPDMKAWILTSLKQDQNGKPLPLQSDPMSLWRFAAAQYAASRSAAGVLPVIAAGTLQQVVDYYGVTYAELAEANIRQPVVALFGSSTSIIVPAFLAFAAGASADSIIAALNPGWPSPGSGAALLALPENAGILPLRIGVVLSIPATNIVVPTVLPPALTEPLATLAAAHWTSASLLANDNLTATGILENGFVFEMDGLTVTIGETIISVDNVTTIVATFAEVVRAFADIGVNTTIQDIAASNGFKPGMLVGGSTMVSQHYIAKAGDTIAANDSGATVSSLASLNSSNANIFDDGAAVYLGVFSPAPTTAGAGLQTLREFADRYACPPAQLLSANPSLALPAGTTMIVPGDVSIPANGAGIWIPYSIAANGTLSGIVANFVTAPGSGSPELNLASANEFMPGVIAGGQTVTVTVESSQYSTQTQPGDSFHSVLDRLQAQSQAVRLSDVVTAIQSTAGYLAQGALLICPVCKVPGSGLLTVTAAAGNYGIDPVSFAQTNAGVLGLIGGGITLYNLDRSVSIVTGASDTFNSILSRFASAGEPIGISEVLTANSATAFINTEASALLPPAPISLQVSLGAGSGPFATPMFPLTVQLRIQRPDAVINPEFLTPNHDGPVEQADATVPAPISPEQSGGESLNSFAAALREAIPTLWLATGRVANTPNDLWVVDFGANGIANVTVAPSVMISGEKQPRFIALRPLYNDLVNRLGVDVRRLDDDGNLGASTRTDFQGIDVEVWAQRFLSDMDLFLTAPYSTGVYANPAARGSLDSILDCKKKLASAIPEGLMTVLDVADPNATRGLTAAAVSLQQQLAADLSSAYRVAAIIQYDASVTSAWTRGAQLKPARLVGNATQAPPASGTPLPRDLPFTLTNAKTALDAASSFVTFMLRIPDPAHSREIDVDLDYGFLDLEFNITPIDGTSGYEASDWLAFVPRISGDEKPGAVHTSLGPASVPIPLRAYPPPPVLLGQSASATVLVEPSDPRLTSPPLASTPLWTFGFTYSHEHAAQDEVLVTAKFNIPPPPDLAATESEQGDVATPLAQYIAVANKLWGLLAGFADPAQTVSATTLANAAGTFAALSFNVASAWQFRWKPPPEEDAGSRKPLATESIPAEQTYSFRVRLSYREDQGVQYYDKLTLVSERTQPGPNGRWPDAFYRAADGSPVRLEPGTPSGAVLVYGFPPDRPIVAEGWPRITLEWPSLNVSAFQNARASMSVRRNQKLLGPDGPNTTSGFLYQTQEVDASGVTTPLLSWPQRIDITSLGSSVAAALESTFQVLFGTTLGLPLTIGVLYGYELIPPSSSDEEGLITYLPVTLYPNQELTANTAAAVAAAIERWQQLNPPPSQRGEWVFAVTLYSQLDSSRKHPLLSLERLIYRL